MRIVTAGQMTMNATMLKAKRGRIVAGSPGTSTLRTNSQPLTSMYRAATT